MRKKRSQIRIGESMAVMIVFFFMLLFGYAFYIKIQQNSFYKEVREISEHRAIQVAQRVYFLPELQCSKGYRLVRESCYDKLKVNEFKKLLDQTPDIKRLFYRNILDISEINISQVYPDSSYSHIIYDYTDVAEDTGRQSKEVVLMPISLYDPSTRSYSFGYLKVTYYYPSSVDT